MNPSLKKLADELTTDPEERGYSTMTAAQAAADLNEPRYVETFERFISMRTLAGALGVAKALQIVEAIRSQNTPESLWIADQLETVQAESGLDISHPENTAYVNALIAGGIVTQAQADQILDLGRRYQSRAQQIGYSTVTEQMILRVREAA
jgi:hypothetical protein